MFYSLKYANVQVVFQEFPGETTLAINISGCPNHCPDCHSKHLWANEGIQLNEKSLTELIEPYKDVITCVGFMGGDQDIPDLHQLAEIVKNKYPNLRLGWYSGKNCWTERIMSPFDYVKFGPYKKESGGLDSPTTNQVMLKRIANKDGSFVMWLDITKYFWKNTPKELKDIYVEITYEKLAILHHITGETMLFQGVGVTVDGYETKMVQPTEENFVKGFVMSLNGQTPPDECVIHEFRRKCGSKDEWEDTGIPIPAPYKKPEKVPK